MKDSPLDYRPKDATRSPFWGWLSLGTELCLQVLYITPFLMLPSSPQACLNSSNPLAVYAAVLSLPYSHRARVSLKLPTSNFIEQNACRFPLNAALPGGRWGPATFPSLPGIWAGSTPASSTLPLTGLGPTPDRNIKQPLAPGHSTAFMSGREMCSCVFVAIWLLRCIIKIRMMTSFSHTLKRKAK